VSSNVAVKQEDGYVILELGDERERLDPDTAQDLTVDIRSMAELAERKSSD